MNKTIQKIVYIVIIIAMLVGMFGMVFAAII